MKSVTDISAMTPHMLVLAFHFIKLEMGVQREHDNLNSCDFESVSLTLCHIKIHNCKVNGQKIRWIKVLFFCIQNALKLT